MWFALIGGWCSAGVRLGGLPFGKKRCGLVRGDMGIEENLRFFRFSKGCCVCQGNLESMQKSGFRFSNYPIFFFLQLAWNSLDQDDPELTEIYLLVSLVLGLMVCHN